MHKQRLKIWLGLTEIAGNFARLKIGLEALGHQVDFIDFAEHSFCYGQSSPPPPQLTAIIEQEKKRLSMRLTLDELKKSTYYFMTKTFWKLLTEYYYSSFRNIFHFISYFKSYDALIFHYGNSFYFKARLIHFNDLKILKIIGVKSFFLMCGSDSRPAFLDNALLGTMEKITSDKIIEYTTTVRKNNESIEKHATAIISNVFSSYFFKKPIVALQSIGNACLYPNDIADTLRNSKAINSKHQARDYIRILHAPSRKDAKGTSEIIQTVEVLKKEGFKLDLIILSGVPNEKILEAIQDCDFVIDQLFSDLPLATFAAEAALYKKPAIIGSYISANLFQQVYSDLGCPPSYLCHPEMLKSAIITLVENSALREDLGKAAQNYVLTTLTPENVAKRYVALIQGKIPSHWWVHPKKYLSALPVGMSHARMEEIVDLVKNSKALSSMIKDLPAIEP